jgi:Fur family iron response transcriptional regulator
VTTSDLVTTLKHAGIQPSAQRVAVASYVLETADHPSADEVLARVQASFPLVSRATVYNTLHVLVDRGLLRELVLAEGRVVYDPRLEPHHHFIDDETGAIEDVPWQAIPVGDVTRLKDYDIREYMLVMRGRKLGGPRRPGRTSRRATTR